MIFVWKAASTISFWNLKDICLFLIVNFPYLAFQVSTNIIFTSSWLSRKWNYCCHETRHPMVDENSFFCFTFYFSVLIFLNWLLKYFLCFRWQIFLCTFWLVTQQKCAYSAHCLCTVHNKMFLLLVKRLKWKSLFFKEAHFLLSCTVIKNNTCDHRKRYCISEKQKKQL